MTQPYRYSIRDTKWHLAIGADYGNGHRQWLDAGLEVTLLEQDATALQRGATRIREHYARRVAAGKVSADRAAECEPACMPPPTDWRTIEAVFEDIGGQARSLARLDQIARPGAILATNTSYLDVDAIAAATARPRDVVGLHFFSPANVMRWWRWCGGAATAPEALETAFGREAAGETSGCHGQCLGLVGNRIFWPTGQCEFMLEEGALPEQVDAALEAFGFAMGPFAVADLSGLDIAGACGRARRLPAIRRRLRSHSRHALRVRMTGAQDRGRLYQYQEGPAKPEGIDLGCMRSSPRKGGQRDRPT